jgi:predicted transcriptional regulator
MSKTLTDRILEFVNLHPNTTAWGIAKNLHASSATVSSTLNLKVKKGILKRKKGMAGSWVYYE